MTRPKSERRSFGTLLERVFDVQFNLSKGMLFDKELGQKSSALNGVTFSV